MLKKVLATMFFVLALSLFSNVEAGEKEFNFVPLTASWGYTGMVDPNIDFLALRTGPSVYYGEILRIPPGAYVEVRGDDGDARWGTGFRRVGYRGIWGYAHEGYIIRVSSYR